MKHKILVVDNRPDLAHSLAHFLEAEGYNVIVALTPTEARKIPPRESIDLAIMGIRLEDDTDPNDRSGLTLAEEINPQIPKIILTGAPSPDLVREALRRRLDGRPLAVDFLSKAEGPKNLLAAVRKALPYREEAEETPEETPAEVIAFALFGDKIKLVSLAADGEYNFLDDAQNIHKILYITTSETLALQALVDELESLINDPKAKEKEFQDFFERNSSFIINDDYKRAHPHVVLTRDNGESLIPDFVLEPIGENSLSDLLELKLPSAPVFVLQKSRMRFSAAVLEACAQLREYSAFF